MFSVDIYSVWHDREQRGESKVDGQAQHEAQQGGSYIHYPKDLNGGHAFIFKTD